jgi:ABC-type Fe3+-hydroxamate transport system substrate-binding protein
MTTLTDARGREFDLTGRPPPRRIVSLVPSTTETLFALGLGEALVGYTRFCVHPADKISPERWVGGTKNPKIERIAALRPDLIVANLEENRAEDVAALDKIAPVWVAYPRTTADAIADLRALGLLVGRATRAEELAAAIEREVALTRAFAETVPPWRFAYLVWREPWMAAGTETFISDLLEQAGGLNLFAGRYPEVHPQLVLACEPDLVLLPTEPYPFRESHRQELLDAGFRPEQVRLVDGEYLCWHGVRLIEGLPYLRSLIPRA